MRSQPITNERVVDGWHQETVQFVSIPLSRCMVDIGEQRWTY
jgi:hypothetical protein